MDPKVKYTKKDLKEVENFLGNKVELDTSYNRPDDIPFFYHTETDSGLIKWVCSRGPNQEIMSVYEFHPSQKNGAVEYREGQLETIEQALACREQHVKDGWKPTEIPAFKVNQDGELLNRKERRIFAKKLLSGNTVKNPQNTSTKKDETKPKEQTKITWKYSDESDESEE